jgi:4-carboxymuconolactone decarboxylase
VERPGLNRRDRSLITIAALITRNQASLLPFCTEEALANGVTPREISEMIKHLAYSAGWESAMAAIGSVGEIFARHGVGANQLAARQLDHP